MTLRISFMRWELSLALRNMSQLARDTGLSREGLYKALSEEGNPTFATVSKVGEGSWASNQVSICCVDAH